MSSREDDIVHCIRLGAGNVKVCVESVRLSDADYSSEEKWGDMIGALLIWKKADLKHVDLVHDSDDVQTIPDQNECCDVGVVIPKIEWMGTIVKVIDDDQRVFATATIAHVDAVLEDILLW